MNNLSVNEIELYLETSLKNLFIFQPNINEFTSQTNQTEWNLAHHYANEVIKHFTDYNCDLDITKTNFNNRRPDIIIHQRGNNDNNLLVIEIKRNGSESDLQSDESKIKKYWFSSPLKYKYGAVVNIFTDGRKDRVFVFKNFHY